MMVLLKTLIRIIGNQLGINARAQVAYPYGTERPDLATKPVQGWKTPVYGSVFSKLRLVCSSTISLVVVVAGCVWLSRT
jgi:hypothetical protein